MKKDFEQLKNTFKSSIKTWDYFVNWEKVFQNSSDLEIALNKLNYLLGKDDFDGEFLKLFNDNKDIIKAIPVLLAVRENNLEVYDEIKKTSQFFDFRVSSEIQPEQIILFIHQTGLIRLFKEDGIKNLVDYVLGVEVGLDSNGRKNRGGKLMERIVERHVKEFSEKKGYEYLDQANAKKIKQKWNIDVGFDKSSRSFDFAIYNPQNKSLKLFEANFYNGGGSKLKAVCGEFRSLYNELKKQGIDFIWVTDGLGWQTTLRPLEETYNHNEYVFNLSMLENGVLDELNW